MIHPADYDEYVPVPGSALRAVDGTFELRLTEELRETGYLDAVRLLAVDRPANMRVLPDERFVAPPHPDFRLFLATDPQLPRARDDAGVDVSSVLASADVSWTRPPALGHYDGLAVPHALELELPGALGANTVRLYLT